jgi:hypothetical protein
MGNPKAEGTAALDGLDESDSCDIFAAAHGGL